VEGLLKDLSIISGGTFKRSKHNIWKYEFISDAIAEKVISLQHISTDKMLADFLTKPLSGPHLRRCLQELEIVCYQIVQWRVCQILGYILLG